MTTTNDYRKEYNKLLKKEKSQEEFLNSALFKRMKAPAKEQLMSQYKDTLFRLNELLQLIGFYRPREILDGFEIVEYRKEKA